MSEEPISDLNSLIHTAETLESEGNLEAAIQMLSSFLADPSKTSAVDQGSLISASKRLTHLKEAGPIQIPSI